MQGSPIPSQNQLGLPASVHLDRLPPAQLHPVAQAAYRAGDRGRLRVSADGQYLRVLVEDDLGVEVELDQRSEGYQWLVSFFVVFFAEAMDKHENAILLRDEPGLSLHGLKQRDFRETVSRLADKNQTFYTTHSPFLVGPDELDLVRVVEMTNRRQGTRIHTSVSAESPASLLPLQEALGYDLAQSLFTHKRNLVLEGLTDYWYIEATSALLDDACERFANEPPGARCHSVAPLSKPKRRYNAKPAPADCHGMSATYASGA